MKEKYFDKIKTIGILLNILAVILCACPYHDLFPIVGFAHTKVTYNRPASTDELKKSNEALYNIMVDAVGDDYASSYYEKLRSTASVAFYERVDNWSKATEKEFIATLSADPTIKEAEQYIGQDGVEKLVNSSVVKVKERVYRNMGRIEKVYCYMGTFLDNKVNKKVDNTGVNEYYVSLVMMSLAFFVSLLCMLKYDKNSKPVLGFVILAASVFGAVGNVFNDKKLRLAVKAEQWPQGHKISQIWPILGYVAYALVIVYALVVIVVDIKGSKKVSC